MMPLIICILNSVCKLYYSKINQQIQILRLYSHGHYDGIWNHMCAFWINRVMEFSISYISKPQTSIVIIFLWNELLHRVTVESNSNNDCIVCVCVCVCVFITASEVLLILKQAAVWKSLLKLQTCTQTQYTKARKQEWETKRRVRDREIESHRPQMHLVPLVWV